MYVPFELAFGT